MGRLLFFIIFLFCFSCTKKSNTSKQPTFLIGNWIRLNDKPGNKTFETWKTDFTGLGYTLKDGKTTFSEQLSIIKLNDTLHLKVIGVNEKPTLFKFINQTDTSFVCVNPQNDFPSKIVYLIDGEQLKAIVSSEDFRIDFVFEKSN